MTSRQCILSLILGVLMGAVLIEAQFGVPMFSINKLTFQAGRSTTNKRDPAGPQMRFLGGFQTNSLPQYADCTVVESSLQSTKMWKCVSNLPKGVSFGTTNVKCEGFNFPGDQFVVDGSCYLEYSLVQDTPAAPPPQQSPYPQSASGVDLRRVGSQRFVSGSNTASRRGAVYPQLTCSPAQACSQVQLSSVACQNGGVLPDGIRVRWQCTTTPALPASIALGPVSISCEPYSSPTDIMVVEGSCSAAVTLQQQTQPTPTPSPQPSQQPPWQPQQQYQQQQQQPRRTTAESLTAVKTLVFTAGHFAVNSRNANLQYPQLRCTGGNAAQRPQPESVQCDNLGLDRSGEIMWHCFAANLPDNVCLSDAVVTCEPAGDRNFVVQGSCVLTYKLNFGRGSGLAGAGSFDSGKYKILGIGAAPLVAGVLAIVVVIGTILICWSSFVNNSD